MLVNTKQLKAEIKWLISEIVVDKTVVTKHKSFVEVYEDTKEEREKYHAKLEKIWSKFVIPAGE